MNTDLEFDIVICIGPKDSENIHAQIEYTKNNIVGYRNIYLVTPIENLRIDNCTTVNENSFPFGLADCQNRYILSEKDKERGQESRAGWYLQQLLKLYAGICIPNILDRWLVIDADTYFLKPTTFIENAKCLYNTGYRATTAICGFQYHRPYFAHMEKLGIGLKRYDRNISGICHHMMFETKYVKEILTRVENIFNENFYTVFLNNIDSKQISGASEYEIYFNYMLINHLDKIKIRNLQWSNIGIRDWDYLSLDKPTTIPPEWADLTLKSEINYDYVSWQRWGRRKKLDWG